METHSGHLESGIVHENVKSGDDYEINNDDNKQYENIYVDITGDESLDSDKHGVNNDSHIYTTLTEKTPQESIHTTDTKPQAKKRKKRTKLCVILCTVIAACVLIAAVFVAGYFYGVSVGKEESGNVKNAVSEQRNETDQDDPSATSAPITTTTTTTTTINSEGLKYDVMIITDEWNPFHTYTLMTSVAQKCIDDGRDVRLGIVTQSLLYPDKPAFNISLTRPQQFLDKSAEYTEQFCCAQVSDLLYQAVAQMRDKEEREDREKIILFVSLYNSQFRDSIADISTAAKKALKYVDRIVSAGFNLHSASNTEGEVYAVTQHARDIYSFSVRNQTETGVNIVDQSLYPPPTLG